MGNGTTGNTSKMPPTPSLMIADALAAFSKAANLAAVATEKQTAVEVNRARAEVEEARRERDEAIEQLNAIKLEKKEWQRRVDGWKTSVDKSDMTIDHQNETIAQLRAEAQQWKDQLLRYEEKSQREIQDWKEQYLRAEKERTRLLSRVDELVAEQLAGASRTPNADPYGLPSTPSMTKRLPLPPQPKNGSRSVPPPFADAYDDRQAILTKSKAASTKPAGPNDRTRASAASGHVSKTPRKQKAGPTTEDEPESNNATRATTASRVSLPQRDMQYPRMIRRVQAVIEVPVKEEFEDEALLSDRAPSTSSEYAPPKKTPGKGGQTPRPGRKSSIKSRPSTKAQGEDGGSVGDDDELIIGAEDDRTEFELYGARPVFVAPDEASQRRPVGRLSTSGKKRKLENDPGSARPPSAKVTKKK